MPKDYFAQHQDDPKEVAALIYFKPGVDLARVQAWVQKLQDEGHAVGATVREYIPAFSSPVFYIP